mmetsp:Transcript_57795/g.62433  ORF Transcript_57795/g.62433 Transcript_57795/m.62433 type:complete len:392 (-) Transcript_57795:258-1433(-)
MITRHCRSYYWRNHSSLSLIFVVIEALLPMSKTSAIITNRNIHIVTSSNNEHKYKIKLVRRVNKKEVIKRGAFSYANKLESIDNVDVELSSSLSSSSSLFSYDMIVVGGGAAGLTAAKFASGTLKRSVLIVEEERLGGDCTWAGCVPSKSLLASAKAAKMARNYAIQNYGNSKSMDEDDDDDDDDKTEEYSKPIDKNDPDGDKKRRERREHQRRKFLELKKKREEKKLAQLKKVRQDGEPILYTTKAPESGWYRMCVTSNWNQVVAEMEMRKESELGGINDDGDVRTYEEQKMTEEDQELEEDTASEEGIKDEDFQETRDKVKDLRRLLNEIQSMQQKERRRLTVHAETNEHSHSSMVLNSLTETLLFMAVTGYQVYTIRRWFSGAPVLGR